MRIVLEKEAYATFDKEAKAKNMTTRQLGKEVINAYLKTKK